ncbi:chromosome segregation in meiosis protein 3 [Chaetomium fimeti]|uniref:Chromosome segregation in meiosis protein n=1 Tax=Chaetomium fimeti TaxID=1854472 RepID=A0AAE0H5H1_9PEZI|nr:chromosome segregation in meiosis protein 3 [Chaetomium fimeti]
MAFKSADTANRGKSGGNFVDDYLADWDDDPFRSPSPEPAKNDKDAEKKKDVLGIDKELDLKKKPRAPRVKLDDTRLLSDKGIPKLRKTAPRLKLKGKGHEFSDAARLLSFYQEWLDDLFPKATFLDALAMVEKTGHKTTMRNARLKWIDELKPRAATPEDDEDNRIHRGGPGPQQPPRVAPIFENTTGVPGERAKTPTADDLFGDDDLYNATPVRNTGSTAPPRQVGADVPDEDDLDALMAEAEAESSAKTQQAGPAPPFGSIFGNGARAMAPATGAGPDDDDLDALMAEAEAQSGPTRPAQPAANESIFGSGTKKQTAQITGDDDDDLDALMAEAEAEAGVQRTSQPVVPKEAGSGNVQAAEKGPNFDDDDDLDALMAEAEAETEAGAGAAERPPGDNNKASSVQVETGGVDDDEEAMAEMDGLW